MPESCKTPPDASTDDEVLVANSLSDGVRNIPRIDLICPECGHIQSEPARVVSTQCRGCLAHYQVREGKVVTRVVPVARFAKPGAYENEPPTEFKPVAPLVPPRKPVPPPMAWWKRMLLRPAPPRQVACFDCDRQFTAGAEAESTQCPGCGGYVSLRNHEIRQSVTRDLRTRGNVIIHREGMIRQSSIHCHDLTVFGKIVGGVVCSGDLVIESGGRINGPIQCRRLRICRKAKVEFQNTVRAEEVLIQGEARGVFHCTGEVVLARRASLQGLVRAQALKLGSGASHAGTFEMVDPPIIANAALAESGKHS